MGEYLTPKQRRALNSGHTMIANTGSNKIGGVNVDFHGRPSISSAEYHQQADAQRAQERTASMRSEIHASRHANRSQDQEQTGDAGVSYEHVLNMWRALHPEHEERTGYSEKEYGGEYEETRDSRREAIQNPEQNQTLRERPMRRPHSMQGGGPTRSVGHAVDAGIDRARRQASRESLQEKTRLANSGREAGEAFERLINSKTK